LKAFVMSLHPEEHDWLEGAVERFEATAPTRRIAHLEPFLNGAGAPSAAARRALMIEIVAIDLERRWRDSPSEAPLLELYIKWLPCDLPSLDDAPAELILEERRARLRSGDPAPLAEYAARFPRHGAAAIAPLAEIEHERRHDAARSVAPLPPARSMATTLDLDAPLTHHDYRIKRMIGAGGICRVYTAVQQSLQQSVALKVLRKRYLSDAVAVERFCREARTMAALQHPHIVGVRGLGRLPDGGYFLVMDLIDGVDLGRLRSTQPLSLVQINRIVHDMAAALYRSHSLGVIHCDLKPSNLLYDSSGRTLLTDFGMAIRLNEQGRAEEPSIGGTIGFLAPEQRDVSGKSVGYATDERALKIASPMLTRRFSRGIRREADHCEAFKSW